MLLGRTVLAVVPARAGSKGVPDKNMRPLLGRSLIAWAGKCLSALPWLEARVISTDSPAYAAEGEKHGLAAPFLRPPELADDKAGAVETLTHALLATEKATGLIFEVILICEPTSPLRRPEDVEGCARKLIETGAESIVAVSPLDFKWHPDKSLTIDGDRLGYYSPAGAGVVRRQTLKQLFWRNGACYALTRDCLLVQKKIITPQSRPYLIEREMINIDRPVELDWAELLMQQSGFAGE